MTKTFASIGLLLVLSGCFPMTAPVGVKGGAEGGEESPSDRTEDFIITSSGPGVDSGAGTEPTARSLPIDLPAGPDIAMRATGPGPIDPKSEVAEAMPLYCLFDRLRYGPNFSSTIRCNFAPPLLMLPEGGGALELKLLLEKNLTNTKIVSDLWGPQSDGIQVRLVYHPLEKEEWDAVQYVDTITAASLEGYNISFPPLPLGPGLLRFYLYKKEDGPPMSPDFHAGDLKGFADKESYEASWPLGGDDFLFVGYFKLTEPVVISLKPAPRDWSRIRRLPALEPEPSPESGGKMLFRNFKDIYPSEP